MTAQKVRVTIVEDEALIRSMLERTIGEDDSLEVVASAGTVQEARLTVFPGSCDVAVIDVVLPDGNGVALGLQLQRADPNLGIMLLSGQDVIGLFNAVQSDMVKPWSYLSKRSGFARDVLSRAVAAAARGEIVIDPYVLKRAEPRLGTDVSSLTGAQLKILRLVAEGLSNAAVAGALHLSERSVESHLLKVYQTLGIDREGTNRRVAAVLMFLQQTGRRWD